MNNKCLDEGTLQGYLDGELSPDMMRAAATHIALCECCKSAAREAETELGVFASAFAVDNSANAPTEKLRQRIDAALQAQRATPQEFHVESIGSGIREWLASFAASLAWSPQRAGAMAGLAAVVLLGAVFVSVRPRFVEPVNNGGGESIAGRATPDSVSATATTTSPDPASVSKNGATELPSKSQSGAMIVKASGEAPRQYHQPRVRKSTIVNTPRNNALVPGEDSYVKTINSLAKAIEVNGDAALRPTARAEYERNLAVIDEAISESRRVVRRNPRDRDAAAFLFSAYQNKVELMSAVADQPQLAAAGR